MTIAFIILLLTKVKLTEPTINCHLLKMENTSKTSAGGEKAKIIGICILVNKLTPGITKLFNERVSDFLKRFGSLQGLGQKVASSRKSKYLLAHCLLYCLFEPFIFDMLLKQKWCHVLDINYGRNSYKPIHMLLVEFRKHAKRGKHLGGTLTMTDIRYLFCPSMIHNKSP